MLKVNELRITNWVMMDGEEYFIRAGEQIDDYSDRMKGIGLTPELLEGVGFYETVENAGRLICWKHGKLTMALWAQGKWQAWINTVDLFKSPQSLHELQNLVFAMTGAELPVDEKVFRKPEEKYS